MALFALFLAALGRAHTSGRDIACACFGGNSAELETVGAHSIVRTALLFVLATMAVFPAAHGRPFAVAGLAAILGALVALASELTRLLGPLRRQTAAILKQLAASQSAPPGAGPDKASTDQTALAPHPTALP